MQSPVFTVSWVPRSSVFPERRFLIARSVPPVSYMCHFSLLPFFCFIGWIFRPTKIRNSLCPRSSCTSAVLLSPFHEPFGMMPARRRYIPRPSNYKLVYGTPSARQHRGCRPVRTGSSPSSRILYCPPKSNSDLPCPLVFRALSRLHKSSKRWRLIPPMIQYCFLRLPFRPRPHQHLWARFDRHVHWAEGVLKHSNAM